MTDQTRQPPLVSLVAPLPQAYYTVAFFVGYQGGRTLTGWPYTAIRRTRLPGARGKASPAAAFNTAAPPPHTQFQPPLASPVPPLLQASLPLHPPCCSPPLQGGPVSYPAAAAAVCWHHSQKAAP